AHRVSANSIPNPPLQASTSPLKTAPYRTYDTTNTPLLEYDTSLPPHETQNSNPNPPHPEFQKPGNNPSTSTETKHNLNPSSTIHPSFNLNPPARPAKQESWLKKVPYNTVPLPPHPARLG